MNDHDTLRPRGRKRLVRGGLRKNLVLVPAKFARPTDGPYWTPPSDAMVPFSGLQGWQSNGGSLRTQFARSLPYSLDIQMPDYKGELRAISLVGIFALYADEISEAVGSVGASIHFLRGHETVHRQDLLNGRHYRDARRLDSEVLIPGDGTSLELVGQAKLEGVSYRVERLSIDLPEGLTADSIRLKDMGSPASFVVFDAFFEYEPGQGCPFRPGSGGIALNELPPIIRVGDRVRFNKSLDQLVEGVLKSSDLDEARGESLTFIAIVLSGVLEHGGSRAMHRIQLDSARRLDQETTLQGIAETARAIAESIAEPLFGTKVGPTARLIDRALTIVERNFAKDLDDASVAEQLGLSTSHFRFLFKEATSQPFHKYLIAVRLEKAKRMLIEEDVPVSMVAASVGFSGLAHFSRAFSQRFGGSPSTVRRLQR